MLSRVPATRGPGRSGPRITRGRTHVSSARVARHGRFRTRLLLRLPGPYHARFGAAQSTERLVRLRPTIEAPLLGTIVVGSTLTLRPRLVANAGRVALRPRLPRRPPHPRPPRSREAFDRQGRAPCGWSWSPSRAPATRPSAARWSRRRSCSLRWLPARVGRALSRWSNGCRSSTTRCEPVDGYYGTDTFEAVLAFQR